MVNIKECTKQLIDRVDLKIRKEKADVVNSLKADIDSIIAEASNKGWGAAVCEYGEECAMGQCEVLPPLVRYATCVSPDYENVPLPMLLPTDMVVFDVGGRNAEIPTIMQRIMLRLLVCMRSGLLKVTAIDRDFGSDFPLIVQLQNRMTSDADKARLRIVSLDHEISAFMNQLADEVKSTYAAMPGCNHIDEYNAQHPDDCRPYHLVLIDDFPNGFSQQDLNLLNELLRNGNARRAGLFVIINANHSGKHFGSTVKRVSLSGQNFLDYRLATGNVAGYTAERWESAVVATKETKQIRNLDGWIKKMKADGLVWDNSTIDGIRVPVGFTENGTIFEFYLAGDTDPQCNDFFALLTGAPNMGKSSLLHNLIVNTSLKYSPKELVFYLVDFSNGATFNIYRKLPHAKALMLVNNKEYAIRILEDIEQECERRARLYEEATADTGRIINKLSDYRIATGKVLPRILLVIDEFQVLFQSHDSFTEAARDKLCNGIRQWRKFGVSVVLSTQSLSGVNFGEDTQSNITYRFAMRQSVENSKLTLRNGAAAHLTEPGQTIMNNSFDGSEAKNVEFRCSWSERHGEQVRYLADLYAERYGEAHSPFVCDSSPVADMAKNPVLLNILGGKHAGDYSWCDLYVGKPDLLRDGHTRVRLRRQRGSNLLIVGDDNTTLVRLMASLLMQLGPQSPQGSRLLVSDCFNPGDEYYGALDGLNGNLTGTMVVHGSEMAAVISDVWNALQQRKEAANSGGFEKERIVVAILNAQDSASLHPVDNGRFTETSEASRQLSDLLREGAQVGIHCIIHSCSAFALMDTNNGIGLKNSGHLFTNTILLRGADSSNLWDIDRVPEVETTGRAVVLNGRLDKERYEQCLAYNRCTVPSTESQYVIDNYLTPKERRQ